MLKAQRLTVDKDYLSPINVCYLFNKNLNALSNINNNL